MFRCSGRRTFHHALGPPRVWRPVPKSDPISDSPGSITMTRARSRGSTGLASVGTIAGLGLSAGSSGKQRNPERALDEVRGQRCLYSGWPRGAEGRCCRGHFPGNLAPSPPERGLWYFRMKTVPWPRGVVLLPRRPLRPRNFQTEVMTCRGRGARGIRSQR